MNWIIWLSIIQVVLFRIIGYIRDISFNYYLKTEGYKKIKEPLNVRISKSIIAALQSAIPFYGLLLILIALFISNESILEFSIDKKFVEKVKLHLLFLISTHKKRDPFGSLLNTLQL